MGLNMLFSCPIMQNVFFLSKAVTQDNADVTISLLAVKLHGNYCVDLPVNINVMYDSDFTQEPHFDRKSGAR